MRRINLKDKFAAFSDAWSPKIIAELNGQHVKLARMEGAFEWHHHEQEDELFFVLEGRLEMHYREEVVTIGPGELVVVPHGVEHRPVAPDGARVLIFEPVSTLNTGNVRSERTVDSPEWI
jgi:mannose-6-phosphate isomerase-like protein (cupin superfamily)